MAGRIALLRQRQPRERSERYLGLIRQLPCLVCEDEAEAAHISMSCAFLGKGGRGIGMKADDRWTVPLCHHHHMTQHDMGEEPFWERIAGYAGYPILVAKTLWAVSPDLDQMRKVITKFRSEAGEK